MSNSGAPLEQEHEIPAIQFDRLLDTVYPCLNTLHKASGSRRFWGILLYRYLSKCMIVNRAHLPPREIPRSVRNDDVIFGPRVGDAVPPTANRRIAPAMHNLGGRILAYRQNRADRALRVHLFDAPFDSSRSILTGFHNVHIIAKHVIGPASWLDAYEFPVKVKSEASKRDELREMARAIDWPLARLALDWLPKGYAEEFASRYSRVQVVEPEQKQFHASFLSSIDSRFVLAKYVEEGAGFSMYQHAAMYGEIKNHLFHHVESTIADRFFTWGWKLRSNDVPFLALRLMKPEHKQFRQGRNAHLWIYVNVRQPFPWNIGVTLDIQDRFFSVLAKEHIVKVVIRPRANKGGSPSPQVCARIQPLVHAIDRGMSKLTRLVREAELVILDMFPSTVFMECVSADFPVIAIVPQATVFTSLAGRFHYEFFRIGLLHHSPESAADFLNNNSVKEWWRRVRKNETLLEFMHTFARTE